MRCVRLLGLVFLTLADHCRCSELDVPLRIALLWWQDVLQTDIVEEHAWEAPETSPAVLLVDARGVPPRWVASLAV